jgi:hypothetical protein
MFKKIIRINDGINNLLYRIIDSDFEQDLPILWHHYYIFCDNVIKVYQDRNLNIVKNTALFLNYMNTLFGYYSKDVILNNPGPLLKYYKDEIDKYLILL